MDSTRGDPGRRKFDPRIRQVVDGILLRLPGVRAGSMFGHPAYYAGRRLVACHYGAQLGVKVPAPLAEAMLRSGKAVPFQPYGRKPMRCWIGLSRRRADDFRRDRGVLLAAVAFAQAGR